MSNFVTDNTSLPAPKSNWRALQVAANLGIVAADWNTLCQAAYDLRAYVLALAGGIGTHGQTIISSVRAGGRASHNSATPLAVGAIAFDPTRYTLAGTTRTLALRALIASGSGATVHVALRNLTDGEDVLIGTAFGFATSLTTTSTATVKLEGPLLEGAQAGRIKPAEKIYELRVWVDNPVQPSDTVELYGADVRTVATIT
jgi:hypothetical protein